MPSEKTKIEVPEDKFNAILKRLIRHKPIPKKDVKASKDKKLGAILRKANGHG